MRSRDKQFKEALDIPRSHLVGTLLKEAVPELDGIAKRSQDQRSPFFLVCRGKEEPLKLTVQEIRDMNHRRSTFSGQKVCRDQRSGKPSGRSCRMRRSLEWIFLRPDWQTG